MEEEYTFEQAKNIIFRFLSFRARSVEEVKRHLTKKGYSEAVVEAVIEWAREYRLLDDAKFAARWVENRKLLKPMGKRRLIHELKEKGIPEAIVASQLSDFSSEEEYQLARNFAETKLDRTTRTVTPEKVMGWLLRRGFSSELCYKIVRELKNNPQWSSKMLNS